MHLIFTATTNLVAVRKYDLNNWISLGALRVENSSSLVLFGFYQFCVV